MLAPASTNIVTCITDTCSLLSVEDDIRALSRINESLQAARTTRTRQRQESRGALLELSRTLEAARHKFTYTQETRECHHDTMMNALDREKFALAKNINDVETLTHSLEHQLRRTQEEFEHLDQDVTHEPGAFNHDEATVLKLSVYRDLGITLREQQGAYEKAIVRSADGKDVHMVALDSKGGSYANHLWELCS